MPVNLLDYQGNAGLGLGSNPDINVPVGDLSVINDTMRNMMLLDNQKNIMLFQQKVKDRDQLEALILNNQTATGEIDPKDQKYFDQDKALVEKAYDKWGGNFNDTAGFRKYQQSVTDLQGTATHAQTRWAGLKKLEQERSQQTLPSKIKQYDDWIEKQSKQPFGSQIVPFQELHSWSMNDVLHQPPPTTTLVPDPTSAFDKEVSTVDYQDILKNKQSEYFANGDITDSIDKFHDQLMQYDQPRLKETIAATDKKIEQYNQERGFIKGQPGFVDPVKVKKNDDGTVTIVEPKTEMAAKLALANNKNFVTSAIKYNKDRALGQYHQAQLKIQQQRANNEARKVGIDASKAKAYVTHLNAATKKILDQSQQEGTDISKEYNDFAQHIKPYSMLLKTPEGTKSSAAIFMDELPQGYQYINGAVVDSKGKVAAGQLKPFVTTDDKKRPYYIPTVVDAKTGKEVDSDFLLNKWKEWKSKGYTGTKDEMVQKLLTLPEGSPIELIIQGKNGTVNYSAMSQAARVMNNLGGAKKGQENIINPPESGPDEPVEPSDPSETNPDNN